MAQDEFIDLYELLKLPPETDTATLRKRLAETYIEAQNNLDHRNAQKRLQYQQMYEVYLPQARHLLLDAARRAEYDRYLLAYRSGKPLSQIEATPAAAKVDASALGSSPDIPEMAEAEENVDPEQLAAEREQVWNKWKSSLNFGEEEPAASASTTSAAATTARPVATAAPVATAPAAAPPKPARVAGTTRATPKAASSSKLATEEFEKQQREQHERNRAAQRQQILDNATQTAGLLWTFISGGATLVICCVLLFALDAYLKSTKNYPFNMQRGSFNITGFIIVVFLAAIGASVGAK
ncbi:MAG TPA: hypothetical protein VF719_11325, partial [Abditibacteriaceae bacterium]